MNSENFKFYKILLYPILCFILFLIILYIYFFIFNYLNYDSEKEIVNVNETYKSFNQNNRIYLEDYCPKNYVKISGGFDIDNDGVKESAFCMMKYEAKKSENETAISISYGKPWVNISQINARKKCKELGDGYYLISNKQWIQAAYVMINISENWIGGKIGNNSLYRGHSDSNPFESLEASNNDSDGFYLTRNLIGSEQRRTFYVRDNHINNDSRLSDNSIDVVWDFAGNIWEWNNDSLNCSNGYPCEQMPKPANSSNQELDKLVYAGSYFRTLFLLRPNDIYNSSYNVGRIYTDNDFPIPSSYIHGLVRGGIFYDDKDAGLFTAYLGISPEFAKETVGFRCVYVPKKLKS